MLHGVRLEAVGGHGVVGAGGGEAGGDGVAVEADAGEEVDLDDFFFFF